jgi:hypothetical protein
LIIYLSSSITISFQFEQFKTVLMMIQKSRLKGQYSFKILLSTQFSDRENICIALSEVGQRKQQTRWLMVKYILKGS